MSKCKHEFIIDEDDVSEFYICKKCKIDIYRLKYDRLVIYYDDSDEFSAWYGDSFDSYPIFYKEHNWHNCTTISIVYNVTGRNITFLQCKECKIICAVIDGDYKHITYVDNSADLSCEEIITKNFVK